MSEANEPGEAERSGEAAGPGEGGAAPARAGWLPQGTETLFGEGARAEEAYGLLTVDVPATSWLPALETARDTLGCRFFDWLSAVDEPGTGFQVCAHVVAVPTGPTPDGAVHRLLLRTTVPHETPVLPTATGVFAGAAWHERETHEMFGVDFAGHPRLVPLLLPDTFEGHPLRKDFVLAARVAKAWPGAKEPGESDHGGPKRRQMLPPGVPDPNEWGPMKGKLPPVPSRPSRGRAGGAAGARAAGERPARRTRSASTGSASQRGGGSGAETAEDAAADGSPEQAGREVAGREVAGREQAGEAPSSPRERRGRTPGTPASDAPWHDARPASGERDGSGGDSGGNVGDRDGGDDVGDRDRDRGDGRDAGGGDERGPAEGGA